MYDVLKNVVLITKLSKIGFDDAENAYFEIQVRLATVPFFCGIFLTPVLIAAVYPARARASGKGQIHIPSMFFELSPSS